MKYRPEIDGLRALAVFSVVFFHAGFPKFGGGFVGVDVFFVISGYLITTIILEDLQRGKFSLVGFYERRARRILPALCLVLAVSIPAAYSVLSPKHLVEFSKSLASAALYVSNILFFNESDYFATDEALKPLLHTWSLAVEEQYYLLFPFFIWGAFRLGRRLLLAGVIGAIALSLAGAQWGVSRNPAAAFYLLPTRFWELMIGGLAACLFTCFVDRDVLVRRIRLSCEAFGLLGIAMIAAAVAIFDKLTPFPSLHALLPTVGALLVIVFSTPQTVAGQILSARWLVGAGLISYSIYLWHHPLFAFARHYRVVDLGDGAKLAIVALSTGLAYLSWRYVEQPFRRRDFLDGNRILLAAGGASLIFVAFGCLGVGTDGFPQRYAKRLARLESVADLFRERDMLLAKQDGYCKGSTQAVVDAFLDRIESVGVMPGQGLQPVPIAVVGDSHSADVAMALREQGLDPLFLGCGGCSMTPSTMSPNCRRIFDALEGALNHRSEVDTIALVFRTTFGELTLASMAETLDYWEKFGKKLIVFTARPEFHNYERRLLGDVFDQPTMDIVSYSERAELLSYLENRGVRVVSSTKLLFDDPAACSMMRDGELLMVDSNHLTRAGARHMGKRMLQLEAFREIMPGDVAIEAASR